ncbi:asparagine synthase (glutamine-hydrolysing) [Myxococcaceae bacterium]|nr:asparagine synthase (glutamine-hydrolysing) [Myxococcaceae bacterium]
MCGIAGFSGHFPAGFLDRANRAIAHRGPDAEGVWSDMEAGVGLAHRRLSIIDLSPAGAQPMASDDGSVVIVFNGEIYNFRELRAELEAMGHRFRGHSDTEVLLHLYLADGERMLERLNGIFAFALWDSRKQSLFLARDGLGVKPLYYATTPVGIVFASEIKALLQAREVARTLDPIALRHYLTYLWCPAPRTLLREVKKLEPGHALWLREGRIERHWRFYTLPFQQPILPMPESEAVGQVRDAVRLAVSRQMVADVPVGAFLSGGLDSSAVVAFARELSEQRLQCFSIELDGEDARREGMAADLPYAQAVARHLDVDLHTIRVGPEMADGLADMIYHLDEPQADPAPLNALFISRLAREHGIKVLLSGAGGDDIFTGYRRHRALDLERYWAWLPQAVRAGLATASRHLPARPAVLRRMGKAFQYAGLNGDARLASYFDWLAPEGVDGLLAPELRAASQGENPLVASLAGLPPDTPAINRMLYLECRHFLADHNLNYTDKMGMAAGVEVRVPLLDQDLVALAARLPVEYKQRGAEGKWIFKKAMEGILPDDVIYRPKTGFGAPLRAWLHGPLKESLGDLISTDSLRRRGWFDPDAVARLLEADRTGRVDASYPLFAVLCVELWARIFLDNVPRQTSERVE